MTDDPRPYTWDPAYPEWQARRAAERAAKLAAQPMPDDLVSTPIKRGTAQRLGLDLPAAYLSVTLEFEVERLRSALDKFGWPPLMQWQAAAYASLFDSRTIGGRS